MIVNHFEPWVATTQEAYLIGIKHGARQGTHTLAPQTDLRFSLVELPRHRWRLVDVLSLTLSLRLVFTPHTANA
jgi:hypothetical protein